MRQFNNFLQKYFSDEISLQNRVFYVTNISAFIACAIGVFGTVSIKLPIVCIALSIVATFLVLGCAIYSFYSKKTKFVSFFLNIIMGWIILPFMFITEGGSQGGSSFYLMTIALTCSFTLKNKLKFFFIIFCLFEYSGLFIFEYYYPEFILPLPKDSVIADRIAGLVITFSILALYVNMFVRQYEKDHKKLKKISNMYCHQANTDELTELFNRRYFKEIFLKNLSDNEKNTLDDSKIFLVMFDIDNFKKINDTYGHPFGDKILKQFAEILFEESSNGSVSCRYGGEEFLIMIKGLSFNYAYAKAESILNKTRTRIFCGIDKNPVTVSAGFVLCEKKFDYTEILKSVDEKLYEAKRTGKNRIVS